MTMDALTGLLDKQAITEVLARYCRGVDRADRATFEACYWPDATDDHIKYVGGLKGLADFVFAAIGKTRTQHQMHNALIEPRGETRAFVESYCHAYHETEGPFGGQEMEFGARYLDMFEKRGGEWRILHRKVLMDWYRTSAATSNWTSGRYTKGPSRGEKMHDDPLHRFEAEWEAVRAKALAS